MEITTATIIIITTNTTILSLHLPDQIKIVDPPWHAVQRLCKVRRPLENYLLRQLLRIA